MASPHMVNHTSSFEDMIALLESASGVDLKALDKGERTIEELYEEILQRDMVLLRNQEDNRAEYYAWSVSIEVFDTRHRLTWFEVCTKTRRPIWVRRPWALRETRRRDETNRNTAIRALAEEADFTLSETDRLIQVSVIGEAANTEVTKVYESDAFRTLRAIRTYSNFKLFTDHFATENEIRRRFKVIDDRGGESDLKSRKAKKTYLIGVD